MAKHRPGYMRNSMGEIVKAPPRVRAENEKAAIRAAYAKKGGRKLDPFPSIRMVCLTDGTYKRYGVKLTPRRREILMAVMHNAVTWRLEPDWSYSWKSGVAWMPYYGATKIRAVLTSLRRMRLVALHKDKPDVNITVKGVSAAMEACDYENTYEKRQLGSGPSG